MARKCVFCGESAKSREHAFPSWLDEIAPGSGKLTNTLDSGAISWDAAGFDIRVKQICRKCNETWMSNIEVTSQALVTELVTHQRNSPLGAHEQIKLATWLYKTGIMLALAYPEDARFVLEEDYRYLYEHKKPPNGTTIWIAALSPELDGEGRVQVGWAKPERLDFTRQDGTPIDPHGYRLSFSVIGLVCQVLRDPHGGKFKRPKAFRDVWTRIRPVSNDPWPPARWFSTLSLEDIAGGRIFTGPEPMSP